MLIFKHYESLSVFLIHKELITTYHFCGWFKIRLVEKTQKFLRCQPHEGIGREEAADVRQQGFIPRA